MVGNRPRSLVYQPFFLSACSRTALQGSVSRPRWLWSGDGRFSSSRIMGMWNGLLSIIWLCLIPGFLTIYFLQSPSCQMVTLFPEPAMYCVLLATSWTRSWSIYLGDKFCCETWAKKSRRQTVLQTTTSQLLEGLRIARLHIKHDLGGLKTAGCPQDSMVF